MGDDQTAAPDGPKSCVPAEFFVVGFGVSPIVYVFHTWLPVAASSARTLPRNVQQGYFGSAPTSSSSDETGTIKRPSTNFGVPVTRATGWSSAFFLQRSAPVAASRL